jgi:hypothetical protein
MPKDIGEMQLGDQRPQAGERRAQRAGIEQQSVFDPHTLERGAAAVGLALADVVPVVVQGDAAAAAGDGGDQQLAACAFVHAEAISISESLAPEQKLFAGKLAPAVDAP